MTDFSPGITALLQAANPAMRERGAFELGAVSKERDWVRFSADWAWATEVYFVFTRPRAAAIASIRRYKKPSPKFSGHMNYETTGWITLSAADSVPAALTALYTGQGDLPKAERISKLTDCVRDGSLIQAFDAQCLEWGLSSWGFCSDGLNARYCSVMKVHDIQRTPIDDGYLWNRVVPRPNDQVNLE